MATNTGALMAQVGKLFIDVNLLARQLNFPPEHGIVGMGYDPQRGGFLIVAGPSLTNAHDEQTIPEIALETSFFGAGFVDPGQPAAPLDQQVQARDPFPMMQVWGRKQ